MSGIVGLYRRDGRPANPAELSAMVNTLAHRGPDGAGQWHAGPVGLGHRLLWTTPESMHEKLPWANQRGDRVITADARIDNREELIELLEFNDRPAHEITDSQLILAAYERWGKTCPEKLLGDFAFAIWDRSEQTLFCARDHFGIRPFYYYHSDELFAFASEIKALFCVADVPRQLDELRVGYHLALTVEDKAITFYIGIRRLLPSHSLTFGPTGIRFWSYWSLDISRELHLGSDDDYAQAFREIFFKAVHCRLRSAFPIGCTLSGGLDSSAVTCVARDLLVQESRSAPHTISAIFDDTPQCDERPYINAVLAQRPMEAHYVHVDRFSPFNQLERAFEIPDEPFSSPTFYILWGLCQAAHEHGIRVLLDGLDGDTAVHHGDSYLAELARAGQWAIFAREASAIARHEGLPSVSSLVHQYALPYLTALARKGSWAAFIRETNGFAKQFGRKRRRARRHAYWYCAIAPLIVEPLRRHWQRFSGRDYANGTINKIILPAFAKRISLPDHIKALTAHHSTPPCTAREEHYAQLTSGLIPYAFELTDKASAAYSSESRHPFFDRRLVEFCLALPPNQKLHQGWIRMIVRRALCDILPEQVMWRGGKTINSPAVTAGLLKYGAPLLDEVILENPGALETYIDVARLRETYERYLGQRNLDDEMLIWQAVTLALWLRYADVDR